MNPATSTLRNEHEAIQKVLVAAEEVAARIKRGNSIPLEILSGLNEFFKEFADRCHHGKEEEALFPLLVAKGLPRDGGPVAVMLAEHDRGRELLRRMSAAVRDGGAQEKNAAQWAAAATEYVDMLHAHINKENNILFVLAERLLTEKEQEDLAAEFERIEIDRVGAGTHERLHRSMHVLIEKVFDRSDSEQD